jgi:predicted PurR-regulated permease PerM
MTQFPEGLLPHLLHHAGLLAGAALLAGLGGTVLFAVLGLAAMLPLLIRLRRRFGTWWAPTIAVILFTVMFAVSTFVIGPALRGAMADRPADSPRPAPTTGGHTSHHR